MFTVNAFALFPCLQLWHEIPSTVGPLSQVRKRKYGRTHIVVYGPPTGDDEEQSLEEELDEDDF